MGLDTLQHVESAPTRAWTCAPCIGSWILTHCATSESESRSVVSDSLRPHGILQARMLEWVAFPFSRASFQPRDWTQVSCLSGAFYQLSHKGSPGILEWGAYPSPVDLPNPGIELGSPTLQADSLLTEFASREVPNSFFFFFFLREDLCSTVLSLP